MNNNQDPFKVINQNPGTALDQNNLPSPVDQRIQAVLKSSPIVLFMKGNPDFPQCGFSANTVGMLNKINKKFNTYDILTDPELRQSLKEYSNWPTYPQLYVNGKLIGGNDIVSEMFQNGELQELLASI